MKHFTYKENELCCEKVRVREVVDRVGTPVYIYSLRALTERLGEIQRAFRRARPLVCFSVKANSNLAVLRSLVSQGAGLDIVSGGELYRAKRACCPPERIVFAGVGKTKAEIREAIRYGILLFNVESQSELAEIHDAAKEMRRVVRVALRVNPDVDPRTHRHIATGKAESKFGIDWETAKGLFRSRSQYPALSLCGIHVHIGSQIVSAEPFVKAFRKVVFFADEIENQGGHIEFVNLGGGLGVPYRDEKPLSAVQFAREILPLFRLRKYRLILEPGRFIAANSGVLVGKVVYLKQTPFKRFAICDTAMNDLMRPALYEAYHKIWPVEKRPRAASSVCDVVGPVCESGDFLAKARSLEEITEGDCLAFMSSGAYGFVMASNYNSRPRGAEVLVDGNKFEIVRKRETYQDLVKGERIPDWLKC